MAHILVLVRHGQSEWNLKNLFTGWHDVGLTQTGIDEAHAAGKALKQADIQFDIAFTSKLQRAQNTLKIMLAELDAPDLETIEHEALNERDYGELTGLNKDDARVKWGEEQVHIWRRSYDVPPPGGESLKNTAERVLPYFNEHILARIKRGENILVAAHGNSLRAVVMALEDMTPDEITKFNIATGAPIVYRLDEAGKVVSKSDLIKP